MNFFKYLFIFLAFYFITHFSIINKHSFANQKFPSTNTSKTTKVEKNKLDVYINDLTNASKNINRNNYETTIYQRVCPYMDHLKSLEEKDQVNQEKRKHFLETVVKIYNKTLNLSSEHYLISCIYNYYNSAEPNELTAISKKILSQKNQQKMQELLKLYDTEEKEGNGDNPQNFTYSTEVKPKISLLLPLKDYEKLSDYVQLTYIQKIKTYYLQFEESVINDLPTQMEDSAQLPLFNFFVIAAAASNFKGKCLIGGVVRSTVYSKRLKRQACPIFGRGCNGSSDNFKCGVIFNNKCISINPVRSISKRCYEAAKNEPVNTSQYKKYESSINNILEQYCIGKRKKYASCRNFKKRITELNTQTIQNNTDTHSPSTAIHKTPPKIETTTIQDSTTEAKAPCTNCLAQNQNIVDEVKKIKQITDSEPSEDKNQNLSEDFINYFSNNIFENSTCKCTGNDGCTKGCQHSRHLSRRQSPPINRCKGKKPMELSSAKCARHVTGSIMKTIHHFLAKYCSDINKDVSKNRNDYIQCVEDFKANKEKNICEHGFIFPSALCAINLDGQSANDYKKIANRRVRRKCEAWNKHNKLLLSINLKQDDGTVKAVPLFKKIPPEKLQQFQSDTSQIPPGSIIVSKSPSKHGHIEIKTNKNKCGPNNDQACFCSDFCRDRASYNEVFSIQSVFQWNPEIIKYIKDNY